MATLLKVLIVEDDAITARAFALSVGSDSSMQMVATVSTVQEALACLKTKHIDVCLVDLGLPDGSGLDVVRAAASSKPPIRSLVVTVFGDEGNIVSAIEAGASGYILKDALANSVTTELATLLQGGSPLSPAVASLVLTKFRQQSVGQGGSVTTTQAKLPSSETTVYLTARETEVLNLIARGFSYQEASDLLKVSVETVSTHLRNVYAKLSVHNRSEAVFEATRLGLLSN